MRGRTAHEVLLAMVLMAVLPGMAMAQTRIDADPELAAAKAALDAGHGAEGLELFKTAAKAGKSEAMAQVARIYLEGEGGVMPDYAAAMEWAQKAADAGAGRGNLLLGQIWMQGLGVAVDPDKALGYFKLAAAGGDMKAGRYAGLIAQQQGDVQTAADWFRQAAEQGDITSQYYLGQAYETGTGVPQDDVAAMAWYQKSASRGDIIASDGMVGMAGLYERGLGVPQDMTKAVAVYQQAAGLGNGAAKAALVRLGK